MQLRLHRHVHRRILVQIAIIAIVAVILLFAVSHDAVISHLGALPILTAFVIGLAVGYLAGRMFLLSWHEDTQKVIMRMDRTSFALIGLYVVFRIFSAQFLGNYFNGIALSAISFAVLDGILIGRFVSLWRNIRRILHEQGVL